ncbi:MAG TPA: hypothetical protein VH105_13475 [Burkholderiales bacterium]|jgi:hypothetical protein|nr:hypothetical protein [Burkholderiales bacterium]
MKSRSKSNKKTLFIIFGPLFVVAAAAVGGGYWFFKYKAPRLLDEEKAAYAQGLKEGASMTEQACYERAVRVLKSPEGQSVFGNVRSSEAFKGCLQSSQPQKTFCEAVPREEDVMAAIAWQLETCASFDVDERYCRPTVTALRKYCASPARAAKLRAAGGAAPTPVGVGAGK